MTGQRGVWSLYRLSGNRWGPERGGGKGLEEGTRASARVSEALTGDSGGGGFQGRVPFEITLVSPQH